MTHCSVMSDTCICLSPHKDTYSHTLLDIEHVFIFRSIGRALFLLTIAMEVQHIDIVEGLHETLTHAAKGRIIEVAVVRNKSENAVSSPLDTPLCKPDEFYIIIK